MNVSGAGSSTRRLDALAWIALLCVPVAVPLAIGNFRGILGDTPLTADMFTLPKLFVLSVLVAAAAVAWATGVILGRTTVRWNHRFWFPLVFLFLSATSAALSVAKPVAFFGSEEYKQGLLTLSIYVLLAFLVMQVVDSARRASVVALSCAFGGGMVGLYTVLQVMGLDPIRWGTVADWVAERGLGVTGNPATNAAILIPATVLAAAGALRERTVWRRFALWMTVGICCSAILLSQARGAWLGTLVGLLVLMPFVQRTRPRFSRVDAAGAAVVLILVVSVGFAMGDRIERRVGEAFTGDRGAGSGRMIILEAGFDAARARPLIGWGPDAYRFADYPFRSNEHDLLGGHESVTDDAHNIALMSAATVGVPATLLLTAFLVMTLVGALRQAWGLGEKGLMIAGWSACTIGAGTYLMTGPGTIGSNAVLWVALGVLCAVGAHKVEGDRRAPRILGATTVLIAAAVIVVIVPRWALADHYDALSIARAGGEAIAAAERAREMAPWSYKYRARIAGVQAAATVRAVDPFQRERAFDSAVGSFEELVDFLPSEYFTYVNYASFLRTSGLGLDWIPDRALSLSERAMEVRPSGLAARAIAADVLLSQGDSTGAVALLEDHWDRDSRYLLPGMVYVDGLRQLGRMEDAREGLTVLEERFPGEARLRTLRSQLENAGGGG